MNRLISDLLDDFRCVCVPMFPALFVWGLAVFVGACDAKHAPKEVTERHIVCEEALAGAVVVDTTDIEDEPHMGESHWCWKSADKKQKTVVSMPQHTCVYRERTYLPGDECGETFAVVTRSKETP